MTAGGQVHEAEHHRGRGYVPADGRPRKGPRLPPHPPRAAHHTLALTRVPVNSFTIICPNHFSPRYFLPRAQDYTNSGRGCHGTQQCPEGREPSLLTRTLSFSSRKSQRPTLMCSSCLATLGSWGHTTVPPPPAVLTAGNRHSSMCQDNPLTKLLTGTHTSAAWEAWVPREGKSPWSGTSRQQAVLGVVLTWMVPCRTHPCFPAHPAPSFQTLLSCHRAFAQALVCLEAPSYPCSSCCPSFRRSPSSL